MKTLILLLSFLSLSAWADVSNIEVVKSPDGKTVNCISDMDVGRSGYRPLMTTLQAVGTDLKFNTGVVSLICAKSRAGFTFNTRVLGEPLPSEDYDRVPTTETFSELKFLMVNQHSDVLMQVDADNAISQAIEHLFPLQSSFSAAELARLKNGETLHVRWEFFLQGLHSVQRGDETIPLGLFVGGTFYINFDLSQDQSGLKVENFRMN